MTAEVWKDHIEGEGQDEAAEAQEGTRALP